jgi:hypothetical protein
MAAVAVAGVASAQATITGAFNLDMANSTTNASKTIGMGDATITFGATEDLGGGMSVAVSSTIQTAGGRNTDTYTNGYSMSIGGGSAGKLTLSNYLDGSNLLSVGVSAANDMADAAGGYTAKTRLAYDLPAMIEGLSAQIRWDNASATLSTANSSTAVAAPEAAGALSSFATTKYSITYATGPMSVNVMGSNAASSSKIYTGTFDAGVAKFAASSTTGQTEYTVSAPVGDLSVGLHMLSGNNKATGMTASYALSKRTSVRYSYVNQTAKGSTNTAGALGTNYRLRLAHSF